MKKYTVTGFDTKENTSKSFSYNDDMMSSAKFYSMVNSNLWNKVVLVDNSTGEILEESEEIPNIF